MFTLKLVYTAEEQEKTGTDFEVFSCHRYIVKSEDRDKGMQTFILVTGSAQKHIVIWEGMTLYVENAAGKTVDKYQIGKNSVCPYCSRHFANLERHMKGHHPAYVEQTKAGER